MKTIRANNLTVALTVNHATPRLQELSQPNVKILVDTKRSEEQSQTASSLQT